MQLKISPDNPLEWLALQVNLVPVPLLHAQVFPVICKAVLEAADKKVFEAVHEGFTTADAVAKRLELNERATKQLLGVLTSLGYFKFSGGHYTLTEMTQKWVLSNSPDSVRDLMVYNNQVVWSWLDQLGAYLKTGKGMDYHGSFTAQQWELYQPAMQAAAVAEAKEFAKRVPVSKHARRMLDIGGAHGLHSVALCKRLPELTSVILDLPGAVTEAEAILKNHHMGERVVHRVGNILVDEVPEDTYDLVLMSSLAHHFTEEQNREVALKVASSLRKGGVFVINEFIRPAPDDRPELVGSSTDLFFGLTSTSGNWSVQEIQAWQKAAGLRTGKVIGYRAIPGRYQVVASK
jgi:SAM-dependent methyltransferase